MTPRESAQQEAEVTYKNTLNFNHSKSKHVENLSKSLRILFLGSENLIFRFRVCSGIGVAQLWETLLKFCSLEWDEKCLQHHKNKRVIKTISYSQARKPIYNTSVKSFKGYEDYLGALKDLN